MNQDTSANVGLPPVFQNYEARPEVMTASVPSKKASRILPIILSLVFFVVVVAIIIAIFLIKRNRDSIRYGDFEETVSYSYELDYALSGKYDAAEMGAINEALEDYYLSLHPSGVGLTLVRYDSFGDFDSFRVVSSFGEFNSIVVQKTTSMDKLKIMIDEYEGEYSLDYSKYTLDDEDYD